METKKWYESKTLWANLILAGVAFSPKLKDVVSEDAIGAAFTVLNIILRLFFTNTKIEFK